MTRPKSGLRGSSSRWAPRGGPGAYFRQLALLADALVLALALPMAYLAKTRLLPADLTPLYALETYIGPALLVALGCLTVLYRRDTHRLRPNQSVVSILLAVGAAAGAGLLLGSAVLFLFKQSYVSRLFLGLYGLTSAAMLFFVHLALRPMVRALRSSGDSAARILVIGDRDEGASLEQALQTESPFGAVVVGWLPPDSLRRVAQAEEGSAQDSANLPGLDDLFARESVDEVAVAAGGLGKQQLSRLILACAKEGMPVHVSLASLGDGLERASLEAVAGLPLLSLSPQYHSVWARATKRGFDFLAAPVLLVLLAPLWLLIALAIKCDSRGPIFFRQERLGLNKRRFGMLKFRTMFEGSDELREELGELNEADGPIFKVRRDPRVTRVGRVLRRLDLDELPQLINVLFGQMTLVGPRPMIPSEIIDFSSWQRKRFSMHPGMTGLWQVRHRLSDPFLVGLQTDLDYIDNWTLRLDLQILMETAVAVLRDRSR